MLYPDFDELLQLGYKASNLKLASRRRVRSIVSGDHDSPFRGKGLEFQEVREYVPGDDIRNIDWRVTARTGRAHMKLFTEERERSVIICTDINATMQFGTRGTFKSIQAARAASLLGWAASRENNRVGGSFFGNIPNGMKFFAPVRSRRSLWHMLKQLCDTEDYAQDYVSLEEHLRYLNKATPSGALVFIISDFIVITDGLKKRLSDLHRKGDVVLVSVNDPADHILPKAGAALFSNGSDRKISVDTSDKQGTQAYEETWKRNREELKHIIRSLKLGSIPLRTDRDIYYDLLTGVKRLKAKGGNLGRSTFAAA